MDADETCEPVTCGGLVVHPGDTLIVWTERLPGLADVVVLNAAGVAAYRPTEEDTNRG